MATQNIDLTTEALDLVTAGSLAAGKTYSVQNLGPSHVVLAELAAAPADDAVWGGHMILPGDSKLAERPSSGSLYVRAYSARATLAVSENV